MNFKVEDKEPLMTGFSVLQYVKLRLLDMYNNFFHEFCDFSLFEELEMNTDARYLALARTRNTLEDCTKTELKETWNIIRKNDSSNEFSTKSNSDVFPPTCCERHNKLKKREPGLFMEEFSCTEMICLRSNTYCWFDKSTDKINFSSSSLNKRTLE